jgi:cyanate permease
MPAASPGARPGSGRVFYGWTVVAAAFLVLFMAYGTQYAFGVFFATLVDEFGWSRASLAGSLAALGPLAAGFIYDRAGDYRLAWWLSAACNAVALLLLASFRTPVPTTADEPAVA